MRYMLDVLFDPFRSTSSLLPRPPARHRRALEGHGHRPQRHLRLQAVVTAQGAALAQRQGANR